MASNSEQLIIQKILNGDVQAFAHIVAKYKDFVYTVVLRMVKNKEDAEEISQDVFVTVFNSLNSYKGTSKFSTWLYTIAYRKSLDKIKGNKKLKNIDSLDSMTKENFVLSQNALNDLEKEERSKLIKKSIQKLHPIVASIFTFYYYDELSVKEIATITNLSPNNVKVKLHRGRNKLYSLLNHELMTETLYYEGKQ